MMIIQAVATWYEKTWWVGTKEVLILLGFLVAAFTYRRNTVVRAQDVKAGQIQRTFDLMQRYPGETRELVLKVTRQLNDGFKIIDELKQEGADDKQIEQAFINLVRDTDLISLLHALDPWGFLLGSPGFLLVDDAMNTFASEISRVLLEPKLDSEIRRILKTSSMNGIPELRKQLRRRKQVSQMQRRTKWYKNLGWLHKN